MLASCDVIEEYHLSIFFSRDLDPLGAVAGGVLRGVDIYDFSVSLVPEEKSRVRVGVHPEIGRVVKRAVLRLPIVI